MTAVKRWAFVPLLLLICIALGNALIDPDASLGTWQGWLLGVALAVPLGWAWYRWRAGEAERRIRRATRQ